MFDGLYFEYPKALSFIFIYIACEAYCKLRSSAIYFPRAVALTQENTKVSILMWLLKWVSIVLLTFSVMSPVRETLLELSPAEGYEIALVLDASRSMEAKGFDLADAQKSRFDVLKAVAKGFIAERENDNIGVVLFGDYAYTASPLTYDRQLLQEIVDRLEPGVAGSSTAIYEAIAQSVKLLRSSEAKNRIAILLTDGHNTTGGRIPLYAAMALVKKEGVRFYTIGIGGEGAYDRTLMEYIAEESGGESYHVADAEALKQVYYKIDRLEKSKIERDDYTFKEYFYIYPLFVAFFTLLLYVYMRNRRGWQ
jgi:Ca-activated chloride channel family protein